MATKQQAINALRKHCESATLIDEQPPEGYQVQLEAPIGYHWQGSVHCYPVQYWSKGTGSDYNKSDYWDVVIEEIGYLPIPIQCADDDCEGVANFGECEYWENM